VDPIPFDTVRYARNHSDCPEDVDHSSVEAMLDQAQARIGATRGGQCVPEWELLGDASGARYFAHLKNRSLEVASIVSGAVVEAMVATVVAQSGATKADT